MPNDVTERDLSGWGLGSISRRIITNEIQETLSARNGTLSHQNQILYEQLFYFQYADEAKMVTVGVGCFTRKDRFR